MAVFSERKPDLQAVLGSVRAHGARGWLWRGGLALAVGLVGLLTVRLCRGEDPYRYTLASVERGDLVVVVTATGSLKPVNQVEVGTEVSGTVRRVLVDYNARVRRGQVLAELDTERFVAQATQSRSSLKSADARLVESRATVEQTAQELQKLERLHELSGGKLPSEQELQSARAAYARAEASESTARAGIEEARARVTADQINLSRAVIRSPINGVVLLRQVEPGQTVAASLQTPVLFLLAENLRELRLNVAVDEADIGRIKDGQAATFTVDAYPDREFAARIVQVRYAPQTVEGVVTYETVLQVDNSQLLLRPGMTATAQIVVERVADALLVPNGALRFRPIVTVEEKKSGGGLLGALMPRWRPPAQPGGAEPKRAANRQSVWILKNNAPLAVPVRTGASDGERSVILSGELRPGQQVLVDMVRAGS